MRNSLLITFFLVSLALTLGNAESCGKKGISCFNTTTYRTCWKFLWWSEYGSEWYTCEDGTYCDQDGGNASCLASTTNVTTRNSTTTTTEASASGCGTAGIHCLDNSIYQTCWWVLWWPRYSSQYYSCEAGYVCDQDTGCAASTTTAAPAVTTVTPEGTTPSCGSYSIYCLNETTYQTCANVWWWQEYHYYTCPDGTVCNAGSSESCIAEVTTTTTTTAPATSNSGCGAKGIHCISDSAYQTCWYLLWWPQYNSGYTTCEDGTVCDQENGTANCVAA